VYLTDCHLDGRAVKRVSSVPGVRIPARPLVATSTSIQVVLYASLSLVRNIGDFIQENTLHQQLRFNFSYLSANSCVVLAHCSEDRAAILVTHFGVTTSITKGLKVFFPVTAEMAIFKIFYLWAYF